MIRVEPVKEVELTNQLSDVEAAVARHAVRRRCSSSSQLHRQIPRKFGARWRNLRPTSFIRNHRGKSCRSANSNLSTAVRYRIPLVPKADINFNRNIRAPEITRLCEISIGYRCPRGKLPDQTSAPTGSILNTSVIYNSNRTDFL